MYITQTTENQRRREKHKSESRGLLYYRKARIGLHLIYFQKPHKQKESKLFKYWKKKNSPT